MTEAYSLDIPIRIWLLLYLYHQRHTYNHMFIIILLLLKRHSQTSVCFSKTSVCLLRHQRRSNRLLYQHRQRHTYNHVSSDFKAVLEISYDTKGTPTGCCTNTNNDIRTMTCSSSQSLFMKPTIVVPTPTTTYVQTMVGHICIV